MEYEKRFISAEELFEAISQQLACNRQAVFTVTGNSMWPFIAHGRDKVIVEAVKPRELRRGDIILFKATENKYMLHRITKLSIEYFETTGDGNLFRDGQFPCTCIVAKVRTIIRKGKKINCSTPKFKFLSHTWMLLFPIRRHLFRIWFCIRRYIHRKPRSHN